MELIEPKDLKPRDLRAVRNVLAEIQQRHPEKLLVPTEVVEEAENEESPLHSYFDWNDTSAAHEWRLVQARQLIRTIEVTMPDDQTETAVRKYVSLRSDRKKPNGGYRETVKVLNSKQMLAELEETAKRDIESLLARYEVLKSLCERVRAAAGIKDKKKNHGRRA